MYFYPQYAFRKLFTWCTLSGSGPDHVQGEIFCGEGFCTGRTVTFAPDGSFLIKEGVSMRIKEVIEKTGLSRRTIQFYISQKLIMPREDPVNGYHDFSEEDVRNLIIISRLRRLDFPVSDIRHILRFPGTASYYFYRQIDTLTKRIDTMRRNVDILARYFEK